MSSQHLLLAFCYSISVVTRLNAQSTTSSGCNYVAVDWDNVKEEMSTIEMSTIGPIIRQYQYVENSTTNNTITMYLPPFPKVWALNGSNSRDIYNETFASIPYPIDTCFPINAATFQSYNFICDNDEPKLRTYEDEDCDTLDLDFEDISQISHCSAASSCSYVSITETYYEDEGCDSLDRLPSAEYNGIYAVDVCLQYRDSSYKYVCETISNTWTIITYPNHDCSTTDTVEKQADSLQCTSYTSLDEFDAEDIGFLDFSIASQFNDCTSIDDFEETYGDFCVSSQVIIILGDEDEITQSTIPQFGPFGIEHVTQTELSYVNDNVTGVNGTCYLCAVDACNVTDNTILIVSEQQTDYIKDTCTGGTLEFVKKVSRSADVKGIIFTSRDNIASVSESNTDIAIPTRIVNPAYANDIQSNTRLSLSCNYRKGYPKEICVSVSCADSPDNECENIKFAGTYIIQNVEWYNSNPTWLKNKMGDIDEQYIWLRKAVSDDDSKLADITPYIKLQWILSSEIGNYDNTSLHCNVTDANGKNVNRDELSNFDGRNCEWEAFQYNEQTNSSLSVDTNVATAPYTCVDYSLVVPIEWVCVKTYQSTVIQGFGGTYYEIASGSSIYVNDDQLAVLKKGCIDPDTYPYACDNETHWILYNETNEENEYQMYAYCGISSSVSVTACHEWHVYNVENEGYERDNSFDVDVSDKTGDKCSEDSDITYSEYSAHICFQLNDSNTDMIYSHVQYIWGEYQILAEGVSFNSRPIYHNMKLENTPFDTYIIWYDPLDSWIFITKSNFATNLNSDFEIILNDFSTFEKVFMSDNEEVIVAYCNHTNSENNNNLKPEECENGWNINGEFYYNSDISLTDECAQEYIDYNKEDSIKDLCLAFYKPADKCTESDTEDCQIPAHFTLDISCDIIDDSYSNGEEQCPVEIDSNGIYTQEENSLIMSNRTYWRKIEADTIYSYVYYHKDLRLWIWTHTYDNLANETDSFEELTSDQEINITAWCLKWDSDTPAECDEFYYYSEDSAVNVNATSQLKDCTFSIDDSINYAQEISMWLIISCLVLALCVFIIGFYKEYMEKRNKKKGMKVSILQNSGNETEVAMVSSIDIAQPDTIVEERSGDVAAEMGDENDKLNVKSVSSGDGQTE